MFGVKDCIEIVISSTSITSYTSLERINKTKDQLWLINEAFFWHQSLVSSLKTQSETTVGWTGTR